MPQKLYEVANEAKKKLIREVRFRAEALEEKDDRTVEIIASTETPVELYWGEMEILLHGEENVDMTWINSRKAPVLLDHWRSKVIGVIEGGRLENKQLIVDARFSRVGLGDEVYRDVIDGIRNCGSIGYLVDTWEITNANSSEETWTATLWTPRELSIVAFPADHAAGVKRQEIIEESLRNASRTDYFIRSDYKEEDTQDMRNERTPPETDEPETTDTPEPEGTRGEEGGSPESTATDPTGDSPEVRTRGQGSEPTSYTQTARQLVELGREMGLDANFAREAIQQRKTLAEFEEMVLEEMGAIPNGDGTSEIAEGRQFEGVEVEEKDLAQFSLIRALYVELGLEEAGFEHEIISDERERREKANLPIRGQLQIPMSVVGQVGTIFQRRSRLILPRHAPIEQQQQRATLIAGTDNVGGHLVAEEVRFEDFIDYLWAESAFLPYATMLPSLQGDIAIPKQLTRIQASWVGETDAAAESNPTFGLNRLTPKDMRVKVPYSRRLSLQSGLSIEPLLRMAIMTSFANFADKELAYGTSANGISGIANIDLVKAGHLKTYPNAGLDYASCLDALSTIGKADAMTAGMMWALSWNFWGQAMQTPRLPNADMPILNTEGMSMMMPGRGEIAGFPAMATTQILDALPANLIGTHAKDDNSDEAFVADASKINFGIWGGLDIEVDDKTTLDQGVFNLVAFWTVDSAYDYDQSFVRLKRATA